MSDRKLIQPRSMCKIKISIINSIAALFLFSGCATGWKARYTADSARQLLNRVNRHVTTVALMDTTKPMLPRGHYSSGSGLSGSELYLFPDGTYMYTEWADIFPETLYDRGTWLCSESLIRLSSDGTLSMVSPKDKVYVALYYDGTSLLDPFAGDDVRSGLVLMGTNWDYSMYIDFIQSYLSEEGWNELDDFESSFLVCTLKKAEDIKAEDIDKIKRSLSGKVCRPDLKD